MLGVGEEAARLWLQSADAAGGDDEFGVWPCNAEIVGLFADLEHCWVQPPMGGDPLRIERSEMVATLTLRGIEAARWPQIFSALQVMQQAAKDEWAGR